MEKGKWDLSHVDTKETYVRKTKIGNDYTEYQEASQRFRCSGYVRKSTCKVDLRVFLAKDLGSDD